MPQTRANVQTGWVWNSEAKPLLDLPEVASERDFLIIYISNTVASLSA